MTKRYIDGIPFPVEAEIVESRTPDRRVLGSKIFNDITAIKKVNYITEVPVTASGYDLLLKHLYDYPVCLEKVLVTHILPGTKNNSGPHLRVVLTTNTEAIPLEMSYLWWLDPTSVPLEDLQGYFKALRMYSEFPTVPTVEANVPYHQWLEPRRLLQKAIKQHRAFLYAGKDYPSMTAEEREHFLWVAQEVPFTFDEWPAVLPDEH